MEKVESINIMAKLNRDTPQHLCYSCAWAKGLLMLDVCSEHMTETTQDANACPFYFKTWNDDNIPCAIAKDGSGNNRIHYDGFRTKNNGGGYWITACPYYEQIYLPNLCEDEAC